MSKKKRENSLGRALQRNRYGRAGENEELKEVIHKLAQKFPTRISCVLHIYNYTTCTKYLDDIIYIVLSHVKNSRIACYIDNVTFITKFPSLTIVQLYTTDEAEKKEADKMKSYTADKTDLEELMADAEMEDRRFIAEKQNVVIISSTAMQVKSDYDIDKQRQLQWNVLTMPKRYIS